MQHTIHCPQDIYQNMCDSRLGLQSTTNSLNLLCLPPEILDIVLNDVLQLFVEDGSFDKDIRTTLKSSIFQTCSLLRNRALSLMRKSCVYVRFRSNVLHNDSFCGSIIPETFRHLFTTGVSMVEVNIIFDKWSLKSMREGIVCEWGITDVLFPFSYMLWLKLMQDLRDQMSVRRLIPDPIVIRYTIPYHDLGQVLATHIRPHIRQRERVAALDTNKVIGHDGTSFARRLKLDLHSVLNKVNNLQTLGRSLDSAVYASRFDYLLRRSRYLCDTFLIKYDQNDYRTANDCARACFFIQLAAFGVLKRAFTYDHFDKWQNCPKINDIAGSRWYTKLGSTVVALRQRERVLLHATIAAEYEMQAQIERAQNNTTTRDDPGEGSMQAYKHHSLIADKLRLSAQQYRKHNRMFRKHDQSIIDLMARFQGMRIDDVQKKSIAASFDCAHDCNMTDSQADTGSSSVKPLNWGYANTISFHNAQDTGFYWAGCPQMLENCGGRKVLRYLPLLAQTTVNPPDEIEYCGQPCNCIVF